MRREDFFPEAILVDHDFEVNVYILAAGEVVCFFFLLLPFQVFHLDSSLLPLLFNLLDLIQGVCFASLHIEIILNSNHLTISTSSSAPTHPH